MRILFAIDTLASGGAQRQAVELAVSLVKRGVYVRFSVYHGRDDHEFFRPRLDQAGIEVSVVPKRSRCDPRFPRRLRADLAARPADLVHAFLLPPCFWSVLAIRGLPPRLRPALIAAERNEQIASSPLEAALQRYVYRRADLVTVNASPVAHEIERRCGVAAQRICYVPNGIDLDAWDRAAVEPCPLDLEEGRFHVGVIGRIAPEKHHELLILALQRIDPEVLRHWCVWVIGAGTQDSPAGQELARYARDSGLEGVLRFHPPQSRIAAIMARLSVIALTSRNEGFPNVVLEGMASRLPIIATRVGDVPNILEHGVSGLIVPPRDPAAFAEALLRVQRLDARERATWGAAGRERVERSFSMDALTDRHLDLYSKLLSGRPSTSA